MHAYYSEKSEMCQTYYTYNVLVNIVLSLPSASYVRISERCWASVTDKDLHGQTSYSSICVSTASGLLNNCPAPTSAVAMSLYQISMS